MIFQLILVQVITFIGLVLVLRKILISSSYKETTRLQQLNEENAQKSKDLARKIADSENEYRVKMSEAEDEIREMKARARQEINDLKDAMIAKGKAEGEHIITQALNSKREMRTQIEEEMQGKSIQLSCSIIRKILSSDEQKLVFDGLLASVFRELEDLEKDQLAAIDFGGASKNTVDVKTTHSLSPRQKEELEKILSGKFGRTISVREFVDKEIISGITIALGSFIIDGSLAERFRKAVEELK